MWELSQAFNELKKFTKLKIHVKHAKATGPDFEEDHVIKRIHFDAKHFTPEGANAKNTFFDLKKQGPNQDQVVQENIYHHMTTKHKAAIDHWYLPCVETFKGGSFPMEMCTFLPNQRFPFKTSPDQVSSILPIILPDY